MSLMRATWSDLSPRAKFESSSRKPPLAERVHFGSSALELERHVQLGAVGFHFSFGIQLHVECDNLRDAKVTECFGRLLDRVRRSLLPGLGAGTDQFNDLVDALRHL